MAGLLDADHQAMLRALGAPEPLADACGEQVRAPTIGEVADLLERSRPVHRGGGPRSNWPSLPEGAVRVIDFELPDLPRSTAIEPT